MEKDQIIYDQRKAMGESIRAMRTAQGWEQEQLAQIAGITTANVRSVEAGKYAVNIDVLNKIAGAIRDWQHWDDLEDWLCKEYGVKDLKGLIIEALPKHGGWVDSQK